MPRLRLLTLSGTSPTTPRLRALRVTGTGTVAVTTPRLRVLRITGTGAVPVRPRVRVLQASGAGTVSLVLAPLSDVAGIEPESKVQITASVQVGAPDGWSWRQISGPAVTLITAGPKVEFTAPSSMSMITVVLGVTASSASVVSAERTVTVQVLPQTNWAYIGGTWKGAPAPVWLST